MLTLINAVLSLGILSGFLFADDRTIEMRPAGLDEPAAKVLTDLVLASSEVKQRLAGARYRVVASHFSDVDSDKEEQGLAIERGRYEIQIYDYTHDKLLTVSGAEGLRAANDVRESDEQPMPTPDEYAEATEILKADKELGAAVRTGRLKPYEAMPGTIGEGERVITVGLAPGRVKGKKRVKHEIVGVNLSRGTVQRFADGAPPTALATTAVCGFPNAYQYNTARGTTGSADVRVARGSETLWTFRVTRPSASSGALGSAIDLKNVFYKGARVLAEAHVPIMNVHYEANRCGPYRDWQYSENYFNATGTNIAAGIRRANSPPQTIFESDNDRGNFRGVALYDDGTSVVLVTELAAGWYRYIAEFRFRDDGTIEPRMKFSAVSNSCVCNIHFHNVYWRFDFDIDGTTPNVVESYNGSNWTRLATEAKQLRDSSHRAWRVVNTATGRGYSITPGPNDGTADSYGRGDVWALHYRTGQLDDSRVRTSTQANLDAFVTGEPLVNTDVVFWYAGHFTHDHGGDEETPHIIGPVLRPLNWPARRSTAQ